MTYPLPGETVKATMRHAHFGYGHYGDDQPAPPRVAVAYALLVLARDGKEAQQARWERRRDHESWDHYVQACTEYHQAVNELLHVMQRHRYQTLVADGARLRLCLEPDGCRREWVAIQEEP